MKSYISFLSLVALVVGFVAFSSHTADASRLEKIRSDGKLRCGISYGLPGFSFKNTSGKWEGMDVDFCRALSSAIFGTPDNVTYISLSAEERYKAIKEDRVDLLSRNSTWTLHTDAGEDVNFVGIIFFDGQGFMVPKKDGISSVLELSGASICVETGTTSERHVSDYFRANRMPVDLVSLPSAEKVMKAYIDGQCSAVSSDATALYARRQLFKDPDGHKVLPEIISKEPLGPAVKEDDDQWSDVVQWTLFALINAEELGISSNNVEIQKESPDPRVRVFLGIEGKVGQDLGLGADWGYNIIKYVGNYGEIFDRNIGKDSKLGFNRGNNNLWNNTGILYAPPIR